MQQYKIFMTLVYNCTGLKLQGYCKVQLPGSLMADFTEMLGNKINLEALNGVLQLPGSFFRFVNRLCYSPG